MRLSALSLASLVAACTLYPGGDDVECKRTPTIEFAPTEYRNPNDLQCVTYGQGCDPSCNTDCAQTGVADPSWGVCYGECESHKTEGECAADSACRVVEDARCAVSLNCITNFLGCYALDMQPDDTIACFGADAWSCSRSHKCMALHSTGTCTGDTCSRPFELCIPQATTPGHCYEPVTCDAASPSCPTGSTPGISGGCYTGACIPIGICQ